MCAEVRDAGGNLVGDGVPVLFSTSRGHFAGSIDTVVGYTTGGVACVFLTSELVAQEIVHATVTATTIGSSGLPLRRSVDVLFYPGAVAGIVVSASTGAAVPGVIAQVLDASYQEVMRDTTGPDGTYLLPLRMSGGYLCELSYTNRYGDIVKVSQRVVVQVPPVGGNPAVYMLGAITGVLVNRGTGQPLRQESIPVAVEQTDQNKTSGGRSMPVSVSTDARGIYVVDSLGMGIYDLRVRAGGYSGALTVADTVAGAFLVDANVGIADVPSFEIVKSVNKRIAEIGDAVTYALDIRNAGTLLSITNIRVIDRLPSAFVFAANSAYCDGRLLPDPTSRRMLEWTLPDTLRPGQTIRIAYMVTLGADALASEGINRAYAAGMTETGDTVRTPEASVQVTVRPGVFTDRGIVIGKVFYDRNGNGYQDEHEQGIGGVELWMEDGTRITTGDDGKYSLPEVIPGQHVIRIYRPSVPTGSSILAPHSEFAGDGISRFVRLTEGGIARADFFLEEPHQASLTYGLIRTPLDFEEAGTLAEYVVHWNDVGKTTSITLRDSLPVEWRFDLSAILLNGTTITLRNERSRVLQLPLEKKSPGSIDTIWVAVCADSTAQSIPVMTGAELELTYAKSRAAIIAAAAAPTCIARVSPEMTGSCEKVVEDLRRRGTASTAPVAAQQEIPGPGPVVLVAPVKPQPESRVDSVEKQAPTVAVKTEEAGKQAAPSREQGTVRRAIKPGKLPVTKPVAPETPSDQNFRMPNLLAPWDGGIMWIAHDLLILALVGILVYGVVRRRKREQVENTIR